MFFFSLSLTENDHSCNCTSFWGKFLHHVHIECFLYVAMIWNLNEHKRTVRIWLRVSCTMGIWTIKNSHYPERFYNHSAPKLILYMIMIKHWLSIYTSMKHSLLSLKLLALALNSLDTLSDIRIKAFTLLF